MPIALKSRGCAAAIAALATRAAAAPSATVQIPATDATPRAALVVACEDGVLQLALRAPARPPHDVLLLELEGLPARRVRGHWQGDALALPAGSALQVSAWLTQARPFALIAEAAPASPRWSFEPSPAQGPPVAALLQACDLSPPAP